MAGTVQPDCMLPHYGFGMALGASRKKCGVVDIFWSYNFPVIAIILLLLAPGFEMRKLIICGMVIIAGGRLGTHILTRTVSHIHEEEGRYQQLRKEWGPKPDRVFFWFFQAQALSNVILAIPFFVICMNPATTLSSLEYAGIALWLISVLGESIADSQLRAFKKDPANKGKVCSNGPMELFAPPELFFSMDDVDFLLRVRAGFALWLPGDN